MHAAGRFILLVAVAVGFGIPLGHVAEAADPEVSLTVAPMRYIFVDGDSGTFREHHWMRDRYTGGISQFLGKYDFANGVAFSTEGHALIDQNDYDYRIIVLNVLGPLACGYSLLHDYNLPSLISNIIWLLITLVSFVEACRRNP